MKRFTNLLPALLLLLGAGAYAQESSNAATEEQFRAWSTSMMEKLNRQRGAIKLPNGKATLNVPAEFYYLDQADSETILVDVWRNPPGSGLATLGMLFPSDVTPFERGAWAVTIEYQEDGYVSDEDADDIDYAALLAVMKKDTAAASAEQTQQGLESFELIGWAAQPFYDKTSHKMHWAKELRFGEQTVNTLNYNVRVLGRHGLLVLNFVAGMDQKALIDSKIDAVLAIAEFDEGARYEEFDPDLDKVAAYGLGALVAGKVIAKTGLLAAAVIFLKKFGVLAFVALGALIGRMLRRKKA